MGEKCVSHLVIYQDFKGKTPDQLERKMEYPENFDMAVEYKRFEEVFK